MKKTIAVDIDDVMAAQAEAFVNYSNKRWGTNLTVEDYDEHWAKVWQMDEHKTQERAITYLTSGTFKEFKVIDNSKEVLKKLAQTYNLVIITSRNSLTQPDTTNWITNHYPGIFSDIHYARIWDKVTPDRINQTKGELVREVGADYLVDDQPKHCLAAAEVGIKAILFGDYPWNKAHKLPEKVTRAKDWLEVLKYFEHEASR